MTEIKRRKHHYGWIIVLACFFLSGGGIGILVNTLGTFIKPVSEALGFTRAEFSLSTSLSSLATMLTYPFWGRYISRHSIRKSMIITGVLMSALIFAYSYCRELWQFYLCSFLLGTMTGSASTLPLTTLINNWFDDSRGTATGLGTCGSGLAMLIIPAVSYIIVNVGWQGAYRFTAIILFLLIELFAIFVIRDRPADKGLKPYSKGEKMPSSELDGFGINVNEARRTVSYKLILIIAFLSGVINTGITNHMYAFVTDMGYSTGFASTMLSVQMFCMMISKLSIGLVFDRFGLKTGFLLSVYAFAIAAACFIVAGFSAAFVILGAAGAGVGAALPAMSMAYSIRQLYGGRDYSAICGFMLSFTFLGNTVGTSLSGIVYDLTGSYIGAWIILLAASILMSVLFSCVLKLRRKETSDEK